MNKRKRDLSLRQVNFVLSPNFVLFPDRFTYIKCIIVMFLPPANEVCEGYVFTGVCLSTRGVCVSGPGRCLPLIPPGQTSPGQTPHCLVHAGIHPPVQCMLGYTHPFPGRYYGPYGIQSTSWEYASHWNAFLFSCVFVLDINSFRY